MVLYSDLLINILSAFLILVIGLIIAQIGSNILRRFLRGTQLNKILDEQLKIKLNLENYLSLILKYLIYLITIILILNKLNVPTKILQVILIIFAILVLIFIIFAFKDWLPNLISGFYIIRTEKVKKGDIIKIKDIKGKVIEVNLLETKIETNNNEFIFIPNSNITQFELIKEKNNGKSLRTNSN